ncbi:MAG: hypothetical protein PHG23_02745 [Candidatus Pacebacteria bacterium]|nr:hypothetical protein [Candidatus Paceibacterota bacterium]
MKTNYKTNKNMWDVLKIIGQVIVLFGSISGFYIAKIIDLNTSITIGILGVIFILCYIEQKSNINKTISPIRFAIVEIQTLFRESGKSIQYSLTETPGSPLKPTEFGLKLIRESGIDKIIEENRSSLFEKLDKKLLKNTTAYDVQEKSREILLSLKNDPIINSVKDYSFNNAIEIDVILRLGGLVLRDEYLKEHPKL